MKKIILLNCILCLFLVLEISVQAQTPVEESTIDFPWVPRVSAFEAYTKYKAGKAILLFGGGDKFERIHIVGSFNLDIKDKESMLRKFPKKGIEIFTYCY